MRAIVLVLGLFSVGAAAQPAPRPQAPSQAKNATLDAAELDAYALPPTMRIYGLARVAEARASVDVDKGASLFAAAFELTRSVPDANERISLQSNLIRKLVQYSPAKAEDLWVLADPEVQDGSAMFLVLRRLNEKDYAGAFEFAMRTPAERQFPYSTLLVLMNRFPPEMENERQQLVVKALAYMKVHPQQIRAPGAMDMAGLLQQHWRKLPRSLVLEAVDVMLAQAKQSEKTGYTTAILRTGDKALSFGSAYDLRAFQMMPILNELDSVKSQAVLKSAPAIAGYLREFPRGIAMPGQTGAEAPTGRMSSLSYSSAPQHPELQGAAQREQTNNASFEKMREVAKLAESDPAAALLKVPDVPELSRASALQAVISAAQRRKMPEVTGAAMDQLFESISGTPLERRVSSIDFALAQAVRSKDSERAQKALSLAVRTAGEYYEQDMDADDPNQASKAVWPSTTLWAAAAFQQARMDSIGVGNILNEVNDADIRAFVKLTASLASVWSGPVRAGGTVRKKTFSSSFGPTI